jgi:hypothetical protein
MGNAEWGMGDCMSQVELAQRTKQFALRVIRLFSRLPKIAEAQVIGNQLLR